jgi:hypothetical protein
VADGAALDQLSPPMAFTKAEHLLADIIASFGPLGKLARSPSSSWPNDPAAGRALIWLEQHGLQSAFALAG